MRAVKGPFTPSRGVPSRVLCCTAAVRAPAETQPPLRPWSVRSSTMLTETGKPGRPIPDRAPEPSIGGVSAEPGLRFTMARVRWVRRGGPCRSRWSQAGNGRRMPAADVRSGWGPGRSRRSQAGNAGRMPGRVHGRPRGGWCTGGRPFRGRRWGDGGMHGRRGTHRRTLDPGRPPGNRRPPVNEAARGRPWTRHGIRPAFPGL